MWLTEPKVWIIVAGVALLIYFTLFRGASYINCFDIIKSYINVFRVEGKLQLRHVLFFVLFPLPLALASSLHQPIEDNLLNTLGVVVSILTATLYIYLGTISSKYDQVEQNDKIDAGTYEYFKKVHQETISIINYEILLSIILLIFCFIKPTFKSFDQIFIIQGKTKIGVQWILDTIIFYMFYSFIINLLIVTKRFNILSKTDISIK